MSVIKQFEAERETRIKSNPMRERLVELTTDWTSEATIAQYMYNFTALGRPIIQFPQDMIAVQELVWQTRPDLIIETGIAHGGSLILSASMLAMLDMCDAIQSGSTLDPKKSSRKVIGIDIDIREHNREAIVNHPMASRIEMIEGSSVDFGVIEKVKETAKKYERVMVCLDSMHTHDHVLKELNGYASLVTAGCYCVVFDTFVEDLEIGFFADRPWDVGNNPKTAVHQWLESNKHFEIDKSIEDKLLITVAPDGFLKRVL